MSQGSNSSGLRRYNERVMLTHLRKYRTASKSDLARATNLTPQAVTRIVDDLEQSELVIREGRRLGGLGQPSTLYAINPAGAYRDQNRSTRSGTVAAGFQWQGDDAVPP